MKQLRTLMLFLIGLCMTVPAHACLAVSENARAWAQCSYKVAYASKDHKFLQKFAHAKIGNRKLLKTAQPRWDRIYIKIREKCGSYNSSALRDGKLGSHQQVGGGSGYVPEDQFMAIADTSDIDKLVRN